MFIKCDRCPAAAAVAVTLESGGLVFCQHHYNEYAPVLLAMGASASPVEVYA